MEWHKEEMNERKERVLEGRPEDSVTRSRNGFATFTDNVADLDAWSDVHRLRHPSCDCSEAQIKY